MKATEIRPGLGVKIDGKLAVLTQVEHRTPGNLRAFIQIKYKEVLSGKTLERRLSSSDEVETVDLDRREMEYLYSDSSGATFMDSETYDQLVVPQDVLGDALLYLTPNTKAIVLMHDGNPVTMEMPASVELEVTDTPPGIKGATATNQLKEATCETGLKTKVPPFITTGEKIRISTADGSYQSRA
ncbi:MAG: elongation factor P [Phycisphaeraceae bacterium]|nr:elongation factor P [Phycisphaeraceae bacterium]MCW5754650.1 elongation factor P [Phycisphaeraceae bacterium]